LFLDAHRRWRAFTLLNASVGLNTDSIAAYRTFARATLIDQAFNAVVVYQITVVGDALRVLRALGRVYTIVEE
jgi:hypothetical protein